MAQMTSATGSLPLRLSKGETLVIKDLAGSHTVTGSLAPREDASASVGAGFVVYGPQPSAVTVTISTTGALDYQVVSGDVTPAVASTGASLAAAINSISESYARSKDRNPRTNATIRSCELVSDTIYADSAALQTAFPAASNANKGGKVGTASSYVIQLSDGTSWTTPAAGVMGYLRSGVSTTGYTATNCLPVGTTLTAPDSGGFELRKPFRLYGAIPALASGDALFAASHYSKAGARVQQPTARFVVATDEPEPIVNGTGSSSAYVMTVDLHDGQGPRSIVDPAITTNPGIFNQAFFGASSGGLNNIKLDLTQLGGSFRLKRTLSLQLQGDLSLLNIRIKAVSSYFQPEESPRILMLTDSLGVTVYLGNMKDAYPAVMQDLMGVPDICLMHGGGTGFVNDASGAGRTHIEKLQNAQLIPQYSSPCLIVIQSSLNDIGRSGVSDAAERCARFALESEPNALVVVTGATAARTLVDQTNAIATENAVKAGLDRISSPRLLWVPMMTDNPQFIRGTGAVNALANDGNADLMFDTGDANHWVTQGHLIAGRDYFAPKIVAALRAWVEAQT